MTHAQDEVPEQTGYTESQHSFARRETTAIDGRIPAGLLREVADELGQADGQSDPDAEGTGSAVAD
ncbi:hypothetical protein OJ963_40500 [Streptomyces sp. RS2]|uniref:hypothetical protein n=1 Tax=Streptomyces sp. RS2 TaxID=1451205 RepID=UPI0021F82E0C|nr:hypothetical protein [Streptomyces sp. RS2]MCW1100073.1 hypothetical protein [Streptomyces sp. RS2]